MLTMRVLFFAGTLAGTFGFHAMVQPRVPHAIAFSLLWGGVWLVINGARISWLLYERYPITLTEEEEVAFGPFRGHLKPRIFKRLVDAGSWRTIEKGTILKEEGCPSKEMLLVLSGKVVLQIEGSPVATVRPGRFVGLPSLNGLLGPRDTLAGNLEHAERIISRVGAGAGGPMERMMVLGESAHHTPTLSDEVRTAVEIEKFIARTLLTAHSSPPPASCVRCRSW
jgi:hypothetical protein